ARAPIRDEGPARRACRRPRPRAERKHRSGGEPMAAASPDRAPTADAPADPAATGRRREVLVRALGDPDAAVREAASRALDRLEQRADVAALRERLRHDDPGERIATLQ